MKLFGQAIRAAGIGAALMLSVSVGHAQSGPFAGFDGAWTGNGTVSLSDGTTERIGARPTTRLAADESEANPEVRQRQLQIRPEQRCYQPGQPDFWQLGRSQPERLRRTPRHRRRRTDRSVRRSQRICRQPDAVDQRQQADRADQLEGRDPGRQHHDGEELTPQGRQHHDDEALRPRHPDRMAWGESLIGALAMPGIARQPR